jgi:ABC-type lipopolysaccharide export system ATPase subunit
VFTGRKGGYSEVVGGDGRRRVQMARQMVFSPSIGLFSEDFHTAPCEPQRTGDSRVRFNVKI